MYATVNYDVILEKILAFTLENVTKLHSMIFKLRLIFNELYLCTHALYSAKCESQLTSWVVLTNYNVSLHRTSHIYSHRNTLHYHIFTLPKSHML